MPAWTQLQRHGYSRELRYDPVEDIRLSDNNRAAARGLQRAAGLLSAVLTDPPMDAQRSHVLVCWQTDKLLVQREQTIKATLQNALEDFELEGAYRFSLNGFAIGQSAFRSLPTDPPPELGLIEAGRQQSGSRAASLTTEASAQGNRAMEVSNAAFCPPSAVHNVEEDLKPVPAAILQDSSRSTSTPSPSTSELPILSTAGEGSSVLSAQLSAPDQAEHLPSNPTSPAEHLDTPIAIGDSDSNNARVTPSSVPLPKPAFRLMYDPVLDPRDTKRSQTPIMRIAGEGLPDEFVCDPRKNAPLSRKSEPSDERLDQLDYTVCHPCRLILS